MVRLTVTESKLFDAKYFPEYWVGVWPLGQPVVDEFRWGADIDDINNCLICWLKADLKWD